MRKALLGLFASTAMTFAAGVHDFTPNSIDGKPAPLAAYKGKVLLLVNVASRCGFTPQYAGLESLYQKYKDRGLVVLGFPSNDFGGQEPGADDEIKTFCSRNYGVSFPMYSKIAVKGDAKAPLYKHLTEATGGEIRWNFTKILVGRDGAIIRRFESKVKPEDEDLVAAVEAALR